jgi:excisionase family DNA binding protein
MTQQQQRPSARRPEQPPDHGEQLSEPAVDRLAHSIKEAAEATGLSGDLLYDEMRVGRLAYIKVGRRRIISRQQLLEFPNGR